MKKQTFHKVFLPTVALVMLLWFSTSSLLSQDSELSVNLSGQWKFMIGDDPEWKNPAYDDKNWDEINVPGSWENQGFYGYDGYAWYRKTFIIPNSSDRYRYYLDLGYIDDVDQTYVNGELVGSTGNFPPNYSTAYTALRQYSIPPGVIKKTNKITIAIRVYDDIGEGGIIQGQILLKVDKNPLIADLDLEGLWKFKTGNCHPADSQSSDFTSWNQILVPGTWEDQGYKDYDGVACYAKEFDLSGQFEGKKMVLLLGQIDDLDMTYLNGVLIGQSGEFNASTAENMRDTYKQFRGYYIPESILNENGKNVIQVKVLDIYGKGGIWNGTIGLITQDNYIKYWRAKRNESY